VENGTLLELVSGAVGKSLETFARKKISITGYALCTDDNLSTLYHVASVLPIGGQKSHWANPLAWSTTAPDAKPLFERIGEYMRLRKDRASEKNRLVEHEAQCFETLVLALEQMKDHIEQRAIEGSKVLILVTSTDPSEELLEKAVAAAKRLNAPELFELWHSTLF
jgi:hypothetical protein